MAAGRRAARLARGRGGLPRAAPRHGRAGAGLGAVGGPAGGAAGHGSAHVGTQQQYKYVDITYCQ